ncbi:Fe-Mn family superoxide dismutase [Candidatus Parcubacteria bacterium]|nr:Fe-Mn family superoxide dismutase [Candidatus Parcubacteria bacterium]
MTKTFEPLKFNIGGLNGISTKSIEEHLGLYAGYVKNFNGICELMGKLMADSEQNAIALSELQRRLSFEFGGMRLHEYYFKHLEGGPTPLTSGGALEQKMIEQFGSVDTTMKFIKNVGMMRGPGWSIMYYDAVSGNLMFGFSEEQHIGHFASLPIILALDVWEHTYILDYGAAGKGKYVDAFLANLNWQTCEKNFTEAQK